jgi:hypothetical protein
MLQAALCRWRRRWRGQPSGMTTSRQAQRMRGRALAPVPAGAALLGSAYSLSG